MLIPPSRFTAPHLFRTYCDELRAEVRATHKHISHDFLPVTLGMHEIYPIVMSFETNYIFKWHFVSLAFMYTSSSVTRFQI